MTIYIDILFCINMLVTFFLLLSVCALTRKRQGFLRLFFGSLLGGFSSLTFFLPLTNILFDIFLKIIIGALIVLITFSFKNKTYYFKRFSLFLAASFIFCGFIMALNSFISTGLAMSNLVIYFNMSPVILVVCTGICYLIINFVSYFISKSIKEHHIYQIELTYQNQMVVTNALLDTGNSLRDLYSGDPVIILENTLAEKLLKVPVASMGESVQGYRLIPYSVVSQKGFLQAFRPDKVVIKTEKVTKEIKATIAVSETAVHDQYKALLSKDINEMLED